MSNKKFEKYALVPFKQLDRLMAENKLQSTPDLEHGDKKNVSLKKVVKIPHDNLIQELYRVLEMSELSDRDREHLFNQIYSELEIKKRNAESTNQPNPETEKSENNLIPTKAENVSDEFESIINNSNFVPENLELKKEISLSNQPNQAQVQSDNRQPLSDAIGDISPIVPKSLPEARQLKRPLAAQLDESRLVPEKINRKESATTHHEFKSASQPSASHQTGPTTSTNLQAAASGSSQPQESSKFSSFQHAIKTIGCKISDKGNIVYKSNGKEINLNANASNIFTFMTTGDPVHRQPPGTSKLIKLFAQHNIGRDLLSSQPLRDQYDDESGGNNDLMEEDSEDELKLQSGLGWRTFK